MMKQRRKNRRQDGFSYIEVMIALVIMLVGILGLTSALATNLIRSYETEKRIVAKQLGLSTIESIISARDVARTEGIKGWDTIGNVGTNPIGGVNQGIFLTGFCPVREDLGWDGVAGTADDACSGTGPCIVAGRPNNTSKVIPNIQRKIVITDVQDPEKPSPPAAIARRRIDVTVRYNVNQIFREETVSTLVTRY